MKVRCLRHNGYLLMLLLALTILVAKHVGAVQPHGLYGIVDQECSIVDSFHLRSPGAEAPAGQVFTPTQTSMVGFDIDIRSQSGDPDVLAQIYSGGLVRASLVEQVHFSVPTGYGVNSSAGAWLHVSLPSGLSVTPNSPYALQLIDNEYSNGSFFLWYQCSDNYSGGSYYICLGSSSPACGPAATGNSFTFRIYSGDFTISSSNISVGRSSGNTTVVSVNSLYNFTSPVALAVGSLPNGVTASFDISTVTPTSNSSANATLTVTVADGVPLGTYSIGLDATDGVLKHEVQLNFTVQPSDFSIYISTSSLHVTQGSNKSATITVASRYGFNSTVALVPSWKGAAPSNVDMTIQSPITPGTGNPANSELTISAGEQAPDGNYTLEITAASGTLTRGISIELQIQRSPTTKTTSTTTNSSISVTETFGYPHWLLLLSVIVGLFLAVSGMLRLRGSEKKIRIR